MDRSCARKHSFVGAEDRVAMSERDSYRRQKRGLPGLNLYPTHCAEPPQAPFCFERHMNTDVGAMIYPFAICSK